MFSIKREIQFFALTKLYLSHVKHSIGPFDRIPKQMNHICKAAL